MLLNKLMENILTFKRYEQLHDFFWKLCWPDANDAYYRDISVSIINVPCNGFGDVIFALKFYSYLKDWFKCKINIITTNPTAYAKLQIVDVDIITMEQKTTKQDTCPLLSRLLPLDITSDLYFIAPITSDFKPSINQYSKLIPSINILNTFTLSEYNPQDFHYEDYDFPTGIGLYLYGMFFTEQKVNLDEIVPKVKAIPSPFILIYVADTEGVKTCIFDFLKMVVLKYKSLELLTIVAPKFVYSSFHRSSKIKNLLKRNYRYISVNGVVVEENPNATTNKVINFIIDIFPVSHPNMLYLMEHSMKDILLTGDQSVTDLLSCCKDKNLFYQRLSWKRLFAYGLADELPNKFLSHMNTTCGSIRAIKYKGNYKKFVKNNDFRVKARHKLNSIFLSAKIFKTDEFSTELYNVITSTTKIGDVKSFLRS